jgi:hypothetical protein
MTTLTSNLRYLRVHVTVATQQFTRRYSLSPNTFLFFLCTSSSNQCHTPVSALLLSFPTSVSARQSSESSWYSSVTFRFTYWTIRCPSNCTYIKRMVMEELKKKKWRLIHSQGQTSHTSEPYYFNQPPSLTTQNDHNIPDLHRRHPSQHLSTHALNSRREHVNQSVISSDCPWWRNSARTLKSRGAKTY